MILDKFKLNDRVALVTGAATGLVAAIAIALSEAGAQVACHGNTRSPVATCEKIAGSGGAAHALTGDLSQPQTANDLVSHTIEHFGRLDILVNNAGTIRRAPAVDYSDDDWSAVIEVNLSSVFRVSKLAGKHMIVNGRGGKRVKISFFLSFSGGLTLPPCTSAQAR